MKLEDEVSSTSRDVVPVANNIDQLSTVSSSISSLLLPGIPAGASSSTTTQVFLNTTTSALPSSPSSTPSSSPLTLSPSSSSLTAFVLTSPQLESISTNVTATTTSAFSLITPFSKLLSPQKSVTSPAGHAITSSTSCVVASSMASKCLFGPSNSLQNNEDFNKMMGFRDFNTSAGRRQTWQPLEDKGSSLTKSDKIFIVEVTKDERSERSLTPTEIICTNNNRNDNISNGNSMQSPQIKRRRTEGHLDNYYTRGKKMTIYTLKESPEDKVDTVWKSPSKFGNNLGTSRLVPKTTPLRLFAEDDSKPNRNEVSPILNCGLVDPLSPNDCAVNLLTYPGSQTTVFSNWAAESGPKESTSEIVRVVKKVPVIQLRQYHRQRHRSQSNPDMRCCGNALNVKHSNSVSLKTRSELFKLPRSKSKNSHSKFDHNNNSESLPDSNSSSDSNGFRTTNTARRDCDWAETTSPTVQLTECDSDMAAAKLFNNTSNEDENEVSSSSARAADECLEDDHHNYRFQGHRYDHQTQGDPYLKLMKNRENIGFVPIASLLGCREDTNESIDDVKDQS